VRREIDVALNENKHIIPVLYRACTIRADLKILQIISFLTPKPYEEAFQEVLRALGLPTDISVIQKGNASQTADATTVLLQQMEKAFTNHDWPDVIRKADYLIKRMPNHLSSTAYRLQGLALLEEGEVEQAQEALETALALVNDHQQRLTLLGDYTALLARQEQWTKVLQRTKEALRLMPNDPSWLATQQQAQSKLSETIPVALPTHEQQA
jgi:tetratricopeptide (TPR) repeat protein